ncbi:transposase [bacterium]|nr:transposase [FCB group bacterium]MBL7191613.1 transposase [bacterium]
MIEAAKTIKRHWDGIVNFINSKINNGFLEGINSLIQATRNRARGFSSLKYFIAMIYMIAGKLNFNLPT